MLRLRLLGSQELERSDGADASEVFAQPKRFALLAYLACRTDGFLRRDTLLAVFWPELDTFAARRALRNGLYQLRQALGEDVFVVRGDDELMVDPTKLWCDVPALNAAVAAERYSEAVSLYRGTLCEGVHVSGVGEEFDTWLMQERTQALGLAVRALQHLCHDYEQAGRLKDAADVAVRATQLAPFDEAWVRRAIIALHASGDRGGAFTLFDAYARRLADEFDAAPDAATAALVNRLRLGNESIPLDVRYPTSRAPDTVMFTPSPGSGAESHARSPVPARSPRTKWVAVFVVTAFAIGGGVFFWSRARPRAAVRQRVIVTVFANRTGDPRLDPIGDMMVDWITRSLLFTRAVDVVDTRVLYARGRGPTGQPVDAVLLARRNGAGLIVDGSYYRSGDSLILTASILDAGGNVLRSVGPLATNVTTPVAVVEATRARVMASLASVVDPRLAALWRVGRSPPAYEAYVSYIDGQDQFWSGRLAQAESSFSHAAQRDTNFDAAVIALATTASNAMDCRVVDSLDNSMSERGRSLSKVEYLSLRVAVARCHGRNDEMYRLAAERAEGVSATSPYLISAASAAMWANHPSVAARLLERIDPAVDLDWMPDPSRGDYWGNLTHAYHLLGRYDDELAAGRRIDEPADLAGMMVRAEALAGLGRGDDALQVMDSSRSRPPEPDLSTGMAPNTDGRVEYRSSAAWVILWIERELHVHGSADAARTAAAHGVAWCDGRPERDRRSPEMRLFKAMFLEETGAFADADALMRQLESEDSANVDYRGILGGLAAERGDTAMAMQLDSWLGHRSVNRDRWGPSYYRARIATLIGRPDSAVVRLRESLTAGAWPMWIHVDPILHRLVDRRDFRALTAPQR